MGACMYVLLLHRCMTRCSASWSVLAVLSCHCGHKKIIEDPCEMGQRVVNKTSCAGLLSQCMQTGILDAASSAHSAPLRATLQLPMWPQEDHCEMGQRVVNTTSTENALVCRYFLYNIWTCSMHIYFLYNVCTCSNKHAVCNGSNHAC